MAIPNVGSLDPGTYEEDQNMEGYTNSRLRDWRTFYFGSLNKTSFVIWQASVACPEKPLKKQCSGPMFEGQMHFF